MLLKFFKTHKAWLAGTPDVEDVEHSLAYARVRVESWLRTGGYAVEQHEVETVTFRIWRSDDVA